MPLHSHVDGNLDEVRQACWMCRAQVESVLSGLFNSLQCTISLCWVVVSYMHMYVRTPIKDTCGLRHGYISENQGSKHKRCGKNSGAPAWSVFAQAS